MSHERRQIEELLQQGVQALRSNRPADARRILQQATSADPNGSIAWMLLAVACRATNDPKAEEEALNVLLQCDPQSVRGHVMKADCRALAGDEPAAIHYYRSALHFAEGRQLSPEVVADVDRARHALAQLQDRAHAKREEVLARRGLPAADWSPRFRHALDIAAGRRKQYFQQPTAFTYPEMPQRQYYEASEFSWAPDVEAATATIRDELVALLDERGTEDFRAYIEQADDSLRLDENKTLLGSKDWSALFLCENGWIVPKAVDRCPITWETVMKADLPRISGWGPTVMFSLLKSGARIAPHSGMFNTRLVCHLPLVVPPGCRFRVGNEVREWEEGKLLIFDDTIEHEAWNEGPEDRVILIFDIWRPELSERERQELTTLFSD